MLLRVTFKEIYIQRKQLNGHGTGITNKNQIEQLKTNNSKNINIDETCLVLDGSKCNRGGRPEITFYFPNLPNLGRATIKTSVATTMITGSTAAGEPMPPHFQFSTMAQSEDTQHVNIRMSPFFPKIKGTFGTNCEKEWPVTLGMN
eukprot:CCRYP_014074-RA/>CCRYP_014074-RA protein AED:0.41 eAED:0.41 QI:0/0/0/1/0/0/2/0/145